MERIPRNRKAFDQKENDFKHLNKKPSMLASINYKSNVIDHPKLLPNINLHNISYQYQSLLHNNQRPSLALEYRKPQVQQRKSLPLPLNVQEQSHSKSYCKIYQKDLSKYLDYSLSNQLNQDFLNGHQVNSALRARMLDWMVEVIQSYKFNPKTYFSGVQIMDKYFAKQNMAIPVQKLHIIGVVSMLIASKMEEVYPFRLKTIFEKIVHKKISIKDLVDMEGAIFNKLQFNTVTATFYDKIMVQLHGYALSNQYPQNFSFDNIINPLKDQKILQEVENYCSFIAKFACYNYDLMTSFDKPTIADVVISLALDILQLTVPGFSKNSLIISTSNFEECKTMLTMTITNYQKLYKGLGNLLKYSDNKVVKKVVQHFEMKVDLKNYVKP